MHIVWTGTELRVVPNDITLHASYIFKLKFTADGGETYTQATVK